MYIVYTKGILDINNNSYQYLGDSLHGTLRWVQDVAKAHRYSSQEEAINIARVVYGHLRTSCNVFVLSDTDHTNELQIVSAR